MHNVIKGKSEDLCLRSNVRISPETVVINKVITMEI